MRESDAGELPIRVHAGVRYDGLEDALERGFRSGSRIGEANPERLAFGWLKLFADGTLGSRTAALLEPREGTDDRGRFTNPPEFLAERTSLAAGAGLPDDTEVLGGTEAAFDLGMNYGVWVREGLHHWIRIPEGVSYELSSGQRLAIGSVFRRANGFDTSAALVFRLAEEARVLAMER